MNECENCQESLAGAELTLPWEDGDNPYARHVRKVDTRTVQALLH